MMESDWILESNELTLEFSHSGFEDSKVTKVTVFFQCCEFPLSSV